MRARRFLLLLFLSQGCGAKDTCSLCADDTCHYPADGLCDDGGPGSQYNACLLGTDCTDCGMRCPAPPPSPPIPPEPPSPPSPMPPLLVFDATV
eukprot:2694741-Prymnesium_polylepis.1